MGIKTLLIAALAALLAGCGDDPAGVRTDGSSTYKGGAIPATQTTYGGTSSSTSPYGAVPATGCGSAALPTAGATTQVPSTTAAPVSGCGSAAATSSAVVPATPVRTGMEATITAKEETGIFSKSLASVTVSVSNHDSVERSRFLLVIFTSKNMEVDVQYRTVRMSGGSTTEFGFKTSKKADSARVELRDTLL